MVAFGTISSRAPPTTDSSPQTESISMKYLPVDYTLSGFHTVGLWIASIGGIVGLIVLGYGIYSSRKSRRPGAAIGFGVLGFALFALSLYAGVAQPNPYSQPAYSARLAQVPEIQRTIEDTYGFKPTKKEVRSLGYPMVKPSEDFKVFGSFDDRKQTEGANFETRKVYLVWADGKLNLSQSTDGESFTELKSKG